MRGKSPFHWLALLVLILVVGYLVVGRLQGPPPAGPAIGSATADDGEQRVLEAFREGRSDLWVEVAGTVERTLSEDRRGARHQRFILRLAGGHTLLISHNIDLAPRVPLAEGDRVEVHGEYEWNDRGGVVHWTHHDPRGQRPGGWIRHEGREYR